LKRPWPTFKEREETGQNSIGRVFTDGSHRQGRDADSVGVILRWAKAASLDVVLWTDLPGHFDHVPQNEFVKRAVDHVQQLPAEAKTMAAEYVWRAPEFIVTPLRTALQAEPWFKKRGS
jgi:LmbE family N-acetylglucosaminyl deacetylase